MISLMLSFVLFTSIFVFLALFHYFGFSSWLSFIGLPVFKGAVGSADLKISEYALLSLNHHNFLNSKPI